MWYCSSFQEPVFVFLMHSLHFVLMNCGLHLLGTQRVKATDTGPQKILTLPSGVSTQLSRKDVMWNYHSQNKRVILWHNNKFQTICKTNFVASSWSTDWKGKLIWTSHAGKCHSAHTANGSMGSSAAFGKRRMSYGLLPAFWPEWIPCNLYLCCTQRDKLHMNTSHSLQRM
jgi:hypothetical protein